jgi:[ribosomal protein S18]-alanine N-acetyltransferase
MRLKNKMLKLREMTINDIEAVHKIEESSFYTPWSKESITKEIKENKLAIYLVACKESEIVGYCGMWHVVTEGHIINVAVLESYRNEGVGSALINALIEIATQKEMIGLTLEVKMSNQNAIRLYTKKGFIVEGIRKNYYSDTKEDALVMWKMIPIKA